MSSHGGTSAAYPTQVIPAFTVPQHPPRPTSLPNAVVHRRLVEGLVAPCTSGGRGAMLAERTLYTNARRVRELRVWQIPATLRLLANLPVTVRYLS